MKLAAWRKREGRTQEWLAAELGCSQPYISQIERSNEPIVPGVAIMIEVSRLTKGAVLPNDFYDLPNVSELGKSARSRVVRLEKAAA